MSKLKSLEELTLSKTDISQLSSALVKLAGANSEVVYVYPYSTYDKRTGLYKMIKSPSDSAVSSKLEGEIKWAVKLEGRPMPYSKDFKSKDEALTYANSIIKRGQGKTISVID